MSGAVVNRRVQYSGDGSEPVDHTYFGDVNVVDLFPSVNMSTGIDLDQAHSGHERSGTTLSIPGNLKTLSQDEVDSDKYLMMMIDSTKHSDEVQHGQFFAPGVINNVQVDVIPIGSPPRGSKSQSSVSSGRSSALTANTMTRVQVVRQNVSLWGDYRIDRFGRIISDSLVQEEKCTGEDGDGDASPLSYVLSEKRAITLKERDLSREGKWLDMLEDWSYTLSKRGTLLKKRLRKGIPNSVRSLIWHRQIDVHTERQKHENTYYYDLLRKEILPHDDSQIRKDLPRLRQHYALFKSPIAGSRDALCQGQASSYNVLKAYSLHDKRVGYVQGMDSIVSMVLQYYPEEIAFWCLERLMNDPCYQLRELYIEGMPKAFLYLFTHTALMRKHVSALSKICEEYSINPIGYAFRWYTLRFSHFHPELALRIMDVYLYEHDKVLYRVALAILKYYEKTLLKLAQNSPEEIISFQGNIEQRNDFVNTDQIDALMQSAMSISLSRDEQGKLYEKWVEDTRQKMMM